MEGLRYEVKQLTKQQERFVMQCQQAGQSRQVDNTDTFPLSQFELDLPLDTEESLDNFEDKLNDVSILQSLVKSYNY